MIVTVTGDNALLRRAELDKIVQDFAAEHGDIAIERLDVDELPIERIYEGLQSTSFLTSRKLVVLREPSKQKVFTDSIAQILHSVADTTDVVIYEPKLDRRSLYYKALKKLTDFREARNLDEVQLCQWAINYAAGHGGSLGRQDAKLLIDRLGLDQQLLRSELDKLLAYDSHITKETILLLTEPLPQSTIFELVDAAFSGNKKRALQLYNEQRSLKVEPQAIIGMLGWQLHAMAVVKTAIGQGTGQVATKTTLSPYTVRKSQALVRDLTLLQIRHFIDRLLALDLQLKTTSVDADEALNLYLLGLNA
jgi:DNA polymerase III delta subunit